MEYLAGNRTGQQSATDSTYFAWDAAGRMISAEPMVGTITLTYNADGQRTAKQGTDGSATGYLYDYKHLLHETDEVGGDIFNTYASTTQEEFGDLIGEDTVPYYHQFDAHANTNAWQDESGNVEGTYKYYAFGQVSSFSIDADAWATLSVDQWAGLPLELKPMLQFRKCNIRAFWGWKLKPFHSMCLRRVLAYI